VTFHKCQICEFCVTCILSICYVRFPEPRLYFPHHVNHNFPVSVHIVSIFFLAVDAVLALYFISFKPACQYVPTVLILVLLLMSELWNTSSGSVSFSLIIVTSPALCNNDNVSEYPKLHTLRDIFMH
jgi:hypothetical protein